MRNVISMLAVITVVALSAFAPPALLITSTAFTPNGMIPQKYTCEGEQDSPPLQVANMPKETKSLALILHDPDAPLRGGFTHWVMWNIDVKGAIPENFKGAEQGANGIHKKGYIGMCPPSGIHHYHFMIYALDTKLDLPATTDKKKLEEAMNGHILAQGDLVGLYEKKK